MNVQELVSGLALVTVSPSWYLEQDLAGSSQHQVILFEMYLI